MKGIYSALINPYKEDGSPNIDALKKVVDYNISICDIDGLYVNGSTGENFNMPHEYKKAIFGATAEHADKRVKLIAQIGCNVIEEIYDLADFAFENGYDAISAVSPFYFPYTKAEIIDHYYRIAEFSKLPFIVYNIPIRTSVALTREDFQKLLSHENIIGVKFTANDFFLLDNIRADFPNKLIYSGYDEMLLSAAVLGTDGAIGTTYNIIGHWAKALLEAVRESDLPSALNAQRKINYVVGELLNTGAILSAVKAVFQLKGIDCGSCRLPMAPVTDEIMTAAAAVIKYIDSN